MQKVILTLSVIIVMFASCEKSNTAPQVIDNPQTEKPNPSAPYEEIYPRHFVQLSDSQKQINNNCNRFAWDFLYQINQQQIGQNCFVSPLSMSIALAMLQNGAEGNTLDQIKAAIGFSNYTLSQVNDYYNTLTTELYKADAGVEFNLANAIWNNQNYPAKEQYINTLKTVFNAEFSIANFADVQLPSVINEWCSKQTNGRIKEMVNTIDANAVILLFNAVYFKAQWNEKFDKNNTEPRDFTTMLDGVVNTDFMHDQRKIKYYENANYQYAEIEMGNGAFNTFFVLPTEGKTVTEVAQLLKTEWDSVVTKLKKEDVVCLIPKYEVRFTTKDANSVLKAMGISDAFVPSLANFAPMIEDESVDVFVSEVIQKTFFAINEESVEAAAVTQISNAVTCVPQQSLPKVLDLNRPFVYGIRESSSGTILFNGCMYNPQEK
ncbi:MAG: serpin family protein [Salinivirgaceae bacterium]|nr:serpin family protein [Salinivirgaceae bacterium]